MDFNLELNTADPVHVQIERQIEKQLRSGDLEPGQRLPTNYELAQKWGVSCTAVQKAMARLTDAGLLERTPRRGTFVRKDTTLAVIGILSKSDLTDETSHAHRCIVRALRSQLGDQRWQCRVYANLGEPPAPGAPRQGIEYQQLADDLSHYPFKGLIELNSDLSRAADIRGLHNLPRSSYGALCRQPDVAVDFHQFGRDAVRHLAELGRKRIVYLRTSENLPGNSQDLDGLFDAVGELGLPQPEIVQIPRMPSGSSLESTIYLRIKQLVQDWKSNARAFPPDALLISDDIAARGATLALIESRVKIPNELVVMSYATAEVDLHYGIPVIRFEYPLEEAARLLLEDLTSKLSEARRHHAPRLVPGRIKPHSSF